MEFAVKRRVVIAADSCPGNFPEAFAPSFVEELALCPN
jgi:hypothetical protein